MADTKISALVEVTNPASTDVYPIVSGGLTKKVQAINAGRAFADSLLSTTDAVDFHVAAATTLFTCPTGKSCVITKVVIRNAAQSLAQASVSFGWTSAAYTDVIANATHTELTGSTLATALQAKAGATVGLTTGTFKVLVNTINTAASSTVSIDVFGYIF